MAKILDTSRQVGAYFFDDKDMFTTYGIAFGDKAYAELLKAPQAKDDYMQVFADEDGTERPDDIFFESISYSLPFVIVGNDVDDILSKYNNFKNDLMSIAYHYLNVPRLESLFRLRYSNMSDFATAQKIIDGTQQVFTFTVQLVNDTPTQNSIFSKSLFAASNAGYSIDNFAFDNAIRSLPYNYQQEAAWILAPGIKQTGKIAGVTKKGDLQEFKATRTSTATYIDKNGMMQTAAVDEPRVNYSSGEAKILIEIFSTNLIPDSVNIASYDGTGTGTQTGDVFLEGSTSFKTAVGTATKYKNITIKANTSYVYSFFAKGAKARMFVDGMMSGGNKDVEFDLTNKTANVIIGTVNSSKIEGYPNGWFRCSITFTSVATGTGVAAVHVKETDVAYSVIGTQLEETILSSYIKTEGAQVTRTTDVIAPIDNLGITDVGSVYADVSLYINSSIIQKDNNNRILRSTPINSSSLMANSIVVTSESVSNKKASMWDAAGGARVSSGGNISVSTPYAAGYFAGANFLFTNNSVTNLKLLSKFDRKFTDTEAQDLTT